MPIANTDCGTHVVTKDELIEMLAPVRGDAKLTVNGDLIQRINYVSGGSDAEIVTLGEDFCPTEKESDED